jgi:hypothetical protein
MSGLSISTSNAILGITPSILNSAGIGEVAANISDPDHSLNYTSGTSGDDFLIFYPAMSDISYVAISGHTAATPANATVELWSGTPLGGGTKIDEVALVRNNNIMFTFPEQDFLSGLTVVFKTVPTTYQMTVSYIAAGKHLTIETGEQAGYKRNWLNRHVTQRTTTNLQVGPVSSLTQNKSLAGTLSLPNEVIAFAEGTWQTFIDFAFDQPFFIKEVSSKPESSYICFDPSFDTNAHGQTTSLDVLKLKFTVFNGL